MFRKPARAATAEAFIGLIAATGIRTGEAMALDRDNADLAGAVLQVRDTKFGKSRLVPLHTTSVEHSARSTRARRDQLCPRPSTSAFFVSSYGTRLNHTSASQGHSPCVLKTASHHHASRSGPSPGSTTSGTPSQSPRYNWYASGADVATCRRRCPPTLEHQPSHNLSVPPSLPTADGRGRQTPLSSWEQNDMTSLAPIMQGFDTDRLADPPAPGSTRWPPTATPSGCCCTMPKAEFGRSARDAGPGRHRRRLRRRLPRPPGDRPRQQHRHPQCPAGRDPLPVQLRRTALPGTRPAHPARPRHPAGNAATPPTSASSPAPRPTRCWPSRTRPPRRAAATTCCCSSPCRPDSGSPN